MGFRRYPETQSFPCTPFLETQITAQDGENGETHAVISRVNLNHFTYPEGTREKFDLETAIKSGENLRSVSSSILETDVASMVDAETNPQSQDNKGE